MISLKFREKSGWRTLVKVQSRIEDGIAKGLDETCNTLVNDIRSNWSAIAPSSPGNPPAIVTGNLDSSVVVDEQGRDEQGRFAGKDAIIKFVRIDTAEGSDPRGRGNYAPVLEDSMDRPFVEPAIERVGTIFSTTIKRMVKP